MDKFGHTSEGFELLDGQWCHFKTKHPLPPLISENTINVVCTADFSFIEMWDIKERDNGI